MSSGCESLTEGERCGRPATLEVEPTAHQAGRVWRSCHRHGLEAFQGGSRVRGSLEACGCAKCRESGSQGACGCFECPTCGEDSPVPLELLEDGSFEPCAVCKL